MKGDPKLSKCDESTLCSGLFLVGPQVVQEDQIVRIAPEPLSVCNLTARCAQFCFVYKYRQRFAIVVNEIATRCGLQTDKAVAECRKHHMYLDDPKCCKATCGAGSC